MMKIFAMTFATFIVTNLIGEVSIPNVFSSGTVISSAKINQNFSALSDGINSISARISLGNVIAFGTTGSPHTITVPENATKIIIEAVGGGGGGGSKGDNIGDGTGLNKYDGGNGGGGGYAKTILTVTSGASVEITVGSGGAQDSTPFYECDAMATAASASNGQDSIVKISGDTKLRATGGKGGKSPVTMGSPYCYSGSNGSAGIGNYGYLNLSGYIIPNSEFFPITSPGYGGLGGKFAANGAPSNSTATSGIDGVVMVSFQ